MKKHTIMIINIILVIIFVITILMIIIDNSSSTIKEKTKRSIKIDNINYYEENGQHELTFSVATDENNKLSDSKYDMYILDSNDNLIYIKKKLVIKSDENYISNVKFTILEDISDYDKIILVVSGEKVIYKRDLINYPIEYTPPTTTRNSIMQID